MNSGQSSQKTTSNNTNCQINTNSQDIPQSYQPEEGAYDEKQEQQKHNQTSTERRDRPSQDVTQAPEES